MQHQNRHYIHGLHAKTLAPQCGRTKFFGLSSHLRLGLILILIGMIGYWQSERLAPMDASKQMPQASELQEQNKSLQAEVERLKTMSGDPSHPTNIQINDLLKRIQTIEQNQNALIDAIKGQHPVKSKQSALDNLEKSDQIDLTKLQFLHGYLSDIENTHIKLAKTLTERSERNARILSLMLATVSDRLVPQQLFGRAPTGSSHNVGGPFIPLTPNRTDQTGYNQDFPEVVTTAIETMQNHARLYRTLVNLPMARPLMGEAEYISGFGTRTDPFTRQPAFHAGIDLKQNPGSAIVSTGNGVVVHAGPADGYGNMVEVAHADGVSTRYGHMSRISVSVGDPISTGQKLGTLGNTGRSTGAHLHYETRIRDQAVNPIPFLQMGERLRMLELNTAGKPM
jgi:murein DD-endopeptidase MepM/ murein hydrolase activator NlpD